ncbi:hypothetical protein, partial [Shewanella algae]|uniref:hypothetical protein n=1 Tax=Shewanella algae TaxID=38313 RepID=UPI00313D7862
AKVLKELDVEHEFQPHDDRMLQVFQAVAGKGTGSKFTSEEFEQIEQHKTVLYMLSDSLNERDAAAAADYFLHLGRALLEVDGIAVKCES